MCQHVTSSYFLSHYSVSPLMTVDNIRVFSPLCIELASAYVHCLRCEQDLSTLLLRQGVFTETDSNA